MCLGGRVNDMTGKQKSEKKPASMSAKKPKPQQGGGHCPSLTNICQHSLNKDGAEYRGADKGGSAL